LFWDRTKMTSRSLGQFLAPSPFVTCVYVTPLLLLSQKSSTPPPKDLASYMDDRLTKLVEIKILK